MLSPIAASAWNLVPGFLCFENLLEISLFNEDSNLFQKGARSLELRLFFDSFGAILFMMSSWTIYHGILVTALNI